uniref:TEP1-F n=1 Tax=Anopheles funestus TaxID=62324 RepID=A0A4Y0BNE4_ANOFN
MAMVRLLLLVVSLLWGFPQDCASQRYAIIASRTVRPHTIYELVVTNLATKTQQFLCEIVNSKEVVVGTSAVEVNPNALKKVEISLEGLEDAKYKLKIWENQKRTLINETGLDYIERSYLVLFQTDKPSYKPGDRVQFRVIFLFPSAYPVPETSRPSIFITDPDKFRIKQWINGSLTSGVFEGSFQLAEYTTLGLWTISASLNQQLYKDTIRVEEYILPLFKIQLQSTPQSFFQCDDPTMSLKLIASFVNGGLVVGNGTVVVRANYNNYPSQTKEVARKEFTINGTTIVNFPTAVVANDCEEERNVWFDVEVTESSTGVSYDTTSLLTIQTSGGVMMEELDENDGFYPGLPMRLKVLVTGFDKKPVADQNITIEYEVLEEDETSTEGAFDKNQTLQTNSNGIVYFRIHTTSKTTAVNAKGIYKNKTFPLVYAYPMYDAVDHEYLVVQSVKAYHKIAENITVDLYCNVKVKKYYYIGYCSGRVCASGVKETLHAVNDHQFTFIAQPRMKPQMKLLVFTVKEDGAILRSSIVIRISATNNPTLNITRTSMGANTNEHKFSIIAERDAFVGMLGVDERVLQRATVNNDISKHKLEMAMRALEDASHEMWTPYDSFASVGVLLLTDGYLPDVGYVKHINEFARAGKNYDSRTREDLPETWIWESVKTPTGHASIVKSLPDTITTWEVSGFSVGPVHGLQILKKPLKVKTTREIFVQLYMPSSMKRLEEITAHCLVHNYGEATAVLLEVLPVWHTHTTLFLAKGATQNVRVKLKSSQVGKLTVKVILKHTNRKVIDTLKQTILVRPEGLMKTVEDVRLLDFTQQTKQKSFTLSISGIQEAGHKSYEEVTLSVIGTFLNLNAFDLEQMARSSHGNGEENLLFLQITMAVYDYLQKTNNSHPATEEKLLSYMEVAYQQLLRYRLADGSFSMFGSLYECGGIWFTASTVESLQKLSNYMNIEKSLFVEALDWLKLQHNEDGSFNESCTIAHPHIQRTGGKELSLASSVLFAFVGSDQIGHYTHLVNKTLSLLLSSNITDVYLMAKTTYLLTLIDHPDASKMLKTLNKEAVTDGKYRYWSVPKSDPTSSTNFRDQETTAYALLANMRQNNSIHLDVIKVAQWLQKHCFAGDHYVSSLERVIALEALGIVASRIQKTVPKMYLEVEGKKFEVNSTNQQLLQTVTLKSHIRSLRMTANGIGLVLIKLSYRYSLSNANLSTGKSTNPSTNRELIDVHIRKKAVANYVFEMELCLTLTRALHAYQSYLWNVALDLPTGYEMSEQQKRYDNTIMSSILLENKSHLELVYGLWHTTRVCETIFAIQPRLWYANDARGLISISSFDTKDVLYVYQF